MKNLRFILRNSKGFTLLEVLIVTAIITVISSMGVGFYLNYSKSVELDSVAKTIVSDLKLVQSKSMIAEGNFKWGIHFVNGSSDYYEIFSTPTDYNDVGKVVDTTKYMFSGVTFSSPASGASTDVVFSKISGGTSAASIVLVSKDLTKTINIVSLGVISIQ